MDAASGLIEGDRAGDVLVLTPQRDLREAEYQAIEAEQREVLRRVAADASIRNVVVDFGKSDYFGSSALSLLLRVRRVVRARGGRMALCNVSLHEKEILQVTRLSGLWPNCGSRQEALRAVQG